MKGTHNPTRRRGSGPGRLLGLLVALIAAIGLTGATAFAVPGHRGTPLIRLPLSTLAAGPVDTVAAMQPSWNLGNTLDAIPDETSWGNPPADKALFDTIRAQGFRSVRIPVTWSGHQSSNSPYTIDATWMNRVKQVVDWAQADGLHVVLNVHHDSWQWIADLPTDHDNVLARFKATWSQIAAKFRDSPQTLLFESNNEPQFNNTTDTQGNQYNNELNTAFHTLVRQSGGNNATRLLMLPTLHTNASQDFLDILAAEMKSLNDPNLVATVHYYGYWPFSVNIAGGTRFDATSQKDMTDTFTRIRDTLTSKGIPVYLGEFGLLSYPDHNHPARVEPGEALKYFEQFGYEARTAGVTTALWDAFNFLNRTTLQWRDPALINQIRSSWTTRSGTASSDRIFLAKSSTIPTRTLALNPNGGSFLGLWQGGTMLAPGRDYTVSGNQLTLTATALTRLAGNRAYGVNATVEARFNRGLPWKILVTTYDRPVLSNATGNTNGVTVPTQFRGDLLATMEATYADGGNAGPTDWTPYQEFNEAFSPDYPGNALLLTSKFVNSLRDNAQATLTFHFWSGATVTYRVTKSGGSVTGTVG
ncbi:cellulase family glycosylhydrolase [Streptomyces sp. WI04-05B]|uniref:cellulase family glycosylhydrolase n=1 Tax=Streptomyces TaxID=1883 RepID=UPI0029B5D156|nr:MULTISPECIES: cellulase family glycosylhydrolase [unclassified Streptomyces]MDX2541494.1 cellulase family glycosylhydrolase [Streptomyces sp. WI04-05B]MDX2583772.1 cellulase family glycosylhydrolase [Streptomyces sp. WI04-05A]MDX3745556.1 cellulase family glycosylhydrolase [Streptomyces sp. AK08-02]